MAQVESNCMTLDYDEVSAFLSELDDGWVLETIPLETPASVASISPRNKLIRSKKPRRYPRVDIEKTRQEIAKLELQLQILKEKHEFRESLKHAQSSCGLGWRLFASRERILMNATIQLNARLRKRKNSNSVLIQRISRLIDRQQVENTTKSMRIACWTVDLDNRARIHRELQTRLESRIKSQLDSIVSKCNEEFDAATCDVDITQWNTFALEDHGVGVAFYESVAFPFSVSAINGEINRWPSLKAHQIFKTEGNDTTQSQDRWQDAALDQRLILRRLVNMRDRTIMLWEDVFRLQKNAKSPSVLVRGSGWVLIAPVAGHGDELSVVHSGGLIRNQATNGSSLQPADALAEDVVAYAKSMQRSRITSLEDVLIGACRQSSRIQE